MDLIPNSEVGGGGGPELTDTQVQLSERARTLGRVRTTAVRRLEEPRATIHLLGRLEVAETRQHTVTAWTGGRIDRLRVESTGAKLRRGQVIATLYSPEIYAAHRDLITASQQLDSLSGGEAFARRSAISNIRSTRRRLELLGVPERVIDRMAEAERPWTDIDIRTPFGGTVTERLVREGEYVQPGTGLYRVADLSKLWVQLDAYETDLQLVDVGAPVELTVASVPDRIFEGRVAFIDPTVDTKTRTVSLRVELDNPDGALRPGMFAEARLSGSIDPAHDRTLVIPESAPLFSGRRSLVYVELPGRDRPTYEAREVRLGDKVEDMYPVIAGLREGERVVSHGAFILDADLQIRGGKSLMMRDVDARDPLDEVLSPSPQLRAALAPVLRAYLDVQEALAADDLAAAREATTSLEETAREVEADGADRRVADAWLELRAELISYATSIRKSGDIAGARRAFEGLSETIKRLLHRFGNPLDEPLRLAYCPMAFDNAGAEWIQRAPEIDNAYFGAEMRRCGEIRQTVDTGGHIVPPGATSEAAESGAATHDHNHTHDHGGTP
jgi:Cu(I)/Ag(I) efflux system membrane fusion protein